MVQDEQFESSDVQPDRSHPLTPPRGMVVPPEVINALYARAAARLERLKRETTVRTYVEAGRILIEELYGGDISAYRRRGRKVISLRAFSTREDVVFSPAVLSRAVTVYELSLSMTEADLYSHSIEALIARAQAPELGTDEHIALDQVEVPRPGGVGTGAAVGAGAEDADLSLEITPPKSSVVGATQLDLAEIEKVEREVAALLRTLRVCAMDGETPGQNVVDVVDELMRALVRVRGLVG